MFPQHLLTLITTSEDVAIVVDNAKQPVSSITEAYRTKNFVNRPDSTVPTLPQSQLNQSPSIPPLCSPRKTKISSRKQVMKRCSSAKSLSKKRNDTARLKSLKSLCRWDSESLPTLGRTNSVDNTNHHLALPLRLPRRRESAPDLDTFK
jgi:hypothetical protein